MTTNLARERYQEFEKHVKFARLRDQPDYRGEDAVRYVEQLEIEIEQAKHVPGEWKCNLCGFFLAKNVLDVLGGNILANTDPTPESCPNCNVPLERVTYFDALKEARNKAIELFNEFQAMVQKQS